MSVEMKVQTNHGTEMVAFVQLQNDGKCKKLNDSSS